MWCPLVRAGKVGVTRSGSGTAHWQQCSGKRAPGCNPGSQSLTRDVGAVGDEREERQKRRDETTCRNKIRGAGSGCVNGVQCAARQQWWFVEVGGCQGGQGRLEALMMSTYLPVLRNSSTSAATSTCRPMLGGNLTANQPHPRSR